MHTARCVRAEYTSKFLNFFPEALSYIPLTKYYYGDEIKDDETGQSENLKGRDNLEDLGVDGRLILKWIV
jgi:hypothetical protein